MGSLVGMFFRQLNRKLVDSLGSEEGGLILASVIERYAIAVIRRRHAGGGHQLLCGHFFYIYRK